MPQQEQLTKGANTDQMRPRNTTKIIKHSLGSSSRGVIRELGTDFQAKAKFSKIFLSLWTWLIST